MRYSISTTSFLISSSISRYRAKGQQTVALAIFILFENSLCRIVQRYAHRFGASVFGLMWDILDAAIDIVRLFQFEEVADTTAD